ncbi:purine nucleoside phosphorylase LACC1-like [Saccostrea echinata]|uniref:purine nucleoside phosphorylase LACC1-like n=1 Tax=Saccostrea echinata TaxID=191078 RepID=UPI002A7F2086|nr:purine nucleoside phosphorylase LACC1-like [Saccostrea echinata]
MALGVLLLSDDFDKTDKDEIFYVLKAEKSVEIIILIGADHIPDYLSQIVKELFKDKVLEILNAELIAGFHFAKNHLDNAMIPEIKVICKRKQKMTFLCQVFFTPAVNWNVVAMGENTSRSSETLESTTKSVRDYLSKLKTLDEVRILQSKLIPNDLFYHGFTTRTGGISSIPGMKSLNMLYTTAKRDPPIIVQENRRRVALQADFDVDALYVAKAVHGNTVHEIGTDPPEDGYDGVVSDKFGITCAAPGADCVIILFADPVRRAFAAVHSGWKGTVANIPSETVKTMRAKFGCQNKNIFVVLGPSICKNCFDFGKDDIKQFEDINPRCVINNNTEKNPTVDLKLAIRTLLEDEGILPENIDDTSSSLCTVEHPDLLYSYRRDGRPFGNQIGFIGLKSPS